MTTYFGKRCLFGLPCASFVIFFINFAGVSFPFGFESGLCDLIVLVPDHCLSYYIENFTQVSFSYEIYETSLRRVS